MIMAVTHKLMW